jgi:hypothetical protein
MRKGQVTLFIMLGILILFVVVMGIFFTTRYFVSPIQPAEKTVQDYVQTCIDVTAARGMMQMGERGGYLTFERDGLPFTFGARPTEGDVLFMSQDAGIAYWWFMQSHNDCTDCFLTRKNIPTLAHLETQLERYITNNIGDCVDGFSPFSPQGMSIGTGTMENDVRFTENDILITTDWPITIQQASQTVHLDRFESRVDIPIKKLWTLGRQIVNDAVQKQRYEHILMHLVATFSDAKFDKLPPVAAVTHGSGIVSWSPLLVEQQLQSLLSTYVPLVRYKNTLNGQRVIVGTGPEQGVFDALFIDLFDGQVPYSIDVAYLDWPIYFGISPQLAGSLRPDIDRSTFIDDLAPPFQTNYYEFFYDVSVPMVVTLEDPAALKGQGYSFLFAMEANVRDNKNMKEWNEGKGTLGPWNAGRSRITSSIPSVEEGTCTCEGSSEVRDCVNKPSTCDLSGETYDNFTACATGCVGIGDPIVKQQNQTRNLFCEPEFAGSGTITFKANDAYTGDVLTDAEVSYGCGSFAACPLGVTDRRGIIRSKLPHCYNGYVKTHLADYYSDTQLFTPEPGKKAVINISLQELVEVSVNVSVYDVRNVTTTPILSSSSLGSNEMVLLSFELQREQTYHTPFVKFASIESGHPVTVDLIPGTYEVRAQLVDEIGYLIPRACSMLPGAGPLPQDDLLVRPGLRGGLVLSGDQHNWVVSQEDLVSAQTVSLGVLRLPQPTCITAQGCILPNCVGLEELQRLEEHSTTFEANLAPFLT